MEKRFDGQVAVITGAGGGLGRAYALAFAKRGAKVVVNDLGVALAGDAAAAAAAGSRPADLVVAEIRRGGGEAVANYEDVGEGWKIVAAAIKTFGRIDILINNAGILRDASFAKMTEQDWDRVMHVHLKGAFACTKAAWPHMVQQKYGRIINTASASGLYGNFGQTNYSAAKMALVGMCKTLAAEGQKYNIKVNCVAPLAGTRMTAGVLPPQIREALKPECVAPVVLYLSSKECNETGQVFEVGAGWVAAVRWQRSQGKTFPSSFTLEDLSKEWKTVLDFKDKVSYPSSLQDSLIMASQQIVSEGKAAASGEEGAAAPAPAAAAAAGSCSKAEKIFKMLAAYLELDKEKTQQLKTKVNSCFLFEIAAKQQQQPVLQWTIDLRQDGEGCAKAGVWGAADATFAVGEEAFCRICLGELNPQVAFLQGKMKIKGSMAAAAKFTPQLFPPISPALLSLEAAEAVRQFLSSSSSSSSSSSKPAAAAAAAPAAAAAAGGHTLSQKAAKLQSAKLFPFLMDHLKSPAGANLVKQVGCIYRVDLLPSTGEGPTCTFYINLKQQPPRVWESSSSSSEPYDCCFTLKDEVFFKLATGQLNPQMAFLQGKMKIKGSTKAAMKFTRDMFPKISKL